MSITCMGITDMTTFLIRHVRCPDTSIENASQEKLHDQTLVVGKQSRDF